MRDEPKVNAPWEVFTTNDDYIDKALAAVTITLLIFYVSSTVVINNDRSIKINKLTLWPYYLCMGIELFTLIRSCFFILCDGSGLDPDSTFLIIQCLESVSRFPFLCIILW